MAKAQPKTVPTPASVDDFLAAVPDATRRDDARAVCDLMKEVTGLEPTMWGPSIVGFGSYHYRYASGHEGDTCVVGFSPRKTSLSLYVTTSVESVADLLAKLGPHTTGKACIYVKRLDDIDRTVLKKLIQRGVAAANRK
jgi:hypothetical protein